MVDTKRGGAALERLGKLHSAPASRGRRVVVASQQTTISTRAWTFPQQKGIAGG